MSSNLSQNIYSSMLWRNFYWSLNLAEFIIGKWVVFYYSLVINFITPLVSQSHSAEYIFICMSNIIILFSLTVIIFSSIIIAVSGYSLINNLSNFFNVLYQSTVNTVVDLIRELRISLCLLYNSISINIINSSIINYTIPFFLKNFSSQLAFNANLYFIDKAGNTINLSWVNNYFVPLRIFSICVRYLNLTILGYRCINYLLRFFCTVNGRIIFNYFNMSAYVTVLVKHIYNLSCILFYNTSRLNNPNIILFSYNLFFLAWLTLNPLNFGHSFNVNTIIENCYYLVLRVFLNYIFMLG